MWLLLCVVFAFQNVTASQVMVEFHGLTTESEEVKFIETYKGNSNATIQAYVVAIEMKQAEYSYNPYTKLKIFQNTKAKLNDLITANPEDVHMRYLRLMLQERCPSFLGYNDHIEEDKKFLKTKLAVQDQSDLLDEYIRKYTSL